MWTIAAYRRTQSPCRLAWFEGRRPVYIQQLNRANFRNGSGRDNTTINTDFVIIIIIIIIIFTLGIYVPEGV